MNKLMQQAQQMQTRMGEVQKELAAREIEVESGGGAVKLRFNGKQELLGLTIDPKVVDPEETDLLEDLLLAAFQEGQKKAAKVAEEEMAKVTGGLGGMPGLF
jgi:hypothetical protein